MAVVGPDEVSDQWVFMLGKFLEGELGVGGGLEVWFMGGKAWVFGGCSPGGWVGSCSST